MKYKKLLIIIFIAVLLSGCQATDLIAKVSVSSFEQLLNEIPEQIAYNNDKGGWEITGSDAKDSIFLSDDFSSNQSDIILNLEAEPFLKAGLNVAKLPDKQYLYDETMGSIMITYEIGDESFGKDAVKSALDTFQSIVKTHRDIIGYHEEGDHYKITLENGNFFAWAKALDKNKIDMAFILDPKPWIDAGVDMSLIKDWKFTEMPMTDKNGKPIKIDVLMKGFDIKE